MRSPLVRLGIATLTMASAAACNGDTINTVPPPDHGATQWTVLVYLAADNNLAPFGVADIDKLEAGGFDPRVRVVVQGEFSQAFLDSAGCGRPSCVNLPNFNTFRYAITGEGPNVPGPNGPTTDIGNRNMTDPAQLREFLKWGQQHYPAKHYLVVLWDHGGGYEGLLTDDTSAPGELMSLTGMRTALTDLPVAVLDFDMCLMGGYETMAKIPPATSFVVFSQELVPGGGNPYTEIIRDLNADPEATPRSVAQMVADNYGAFYASTEDATTISAYDMAGFARLDRDVTSLATMLHGHLPTLGSSISTAAFASQSFAQQNKDIVDFLDSLRAHAPTALGQPALDSLQSAIETLRSTVVDSAFRLRNHINEAPGPFDVSRANGLSIVLPSGIGDDRFDASGTASLGAYQALFPEAEWTRFLTAFVAQQTLTLAQAATPALPSPRCVSR